MEFSALASSSPNTNANAANVAAPSAPAPSVLTFIPPPVVKPTVNPPTDSSYPRPFTDEKTSPIRKVISSRLTASKSEVPHLYLKHSLNLTPTLKFLKSLKTDHGVKCSVNDMVIKATALALRDSPKMNSSFDVKGNEVQPFKDVDISVAVSTPTGLITPIVTKADSLSLTEISAGVRDLATRAKEGKLKPEEYQGGSFTISNLGMFGISDFTAVINPPQGAILAVGSAIKTIVPKRNKTVIMGEEILEEGSRGVEIEDVLTLCLSVDRRVGDERVGGEFLDILGKYLEAPERLML